MSKKITEIDADVIDGHKIYLYEKNKYISERLRQMIQMIETGIIGDELNEYDTGRSPKCVKGHLNCDICPLETKKVCRRVLL